MPVSPGSARRNAFNASDGFANGLGWLPTTPLVVSVSGSAPAFTSSALPWMFQFVVQHERQFCTLNGKPLVQRKMPESDQSPMIAFITDPAPPPNLRPSPNGSSTNPFTLI